MVCHLHNLGGCSLRSQKVVKCPTLQGLCADELVDITEALASCEGEDEECSPLSVKEHGFW